MGLLQEGDSLFVVNYTSESNRFKYLPRVRLGDCPEHGSVMAVRICDSGVYVCPHTQHSKSSATPRDFAPGRRR
ncbi:hypothetical protein A3D00_01670 [Candidatus Woesebacteria bacterium RIFCSPHIGHO2_02_FULL_38_9]|nr:MAG: hypothetical protein A3D00_01670 [Candidatus Woesebacteria bacterium RIFCSPHIGHO2_02_FULL_38_9]OGM58543.1 MAG: hypothetical protein A3A50_00790 [Candidatus Woesebacteria bacterium RIFCSPLOWO2_01_FULL_38_20]